MREFIFNDEKEFASTVYVFENTELICSGSCRLELEVELDEYKDEDELDDRGLARGVRM